jgi:hypothetical protein
VGVKMMEINTNWIAGAWRPMNPMHLAAARRLAVTLSQSAYHLLPGAQRDAYIVLWNLLSELGGHYISRMRSYLASWSRYRALPGPVMIFQRPGRDARARS